MVSLENNFRTDGGLYRNIKLLPWEFSFLTSHDIFYPIVVGAIQNVLLSR